VVHRQFQHGLFEIELSFIVIYVMKICQWKSSLYYVEHFSAIKAIDLEKYVDSPSSNLGVSRNILDDMPQSLLVSFDLYVVEMCVHVSDQHDYRCLDAWVMLD